MVNSVSPQGAAFTEGNEGFVSHYYKDSGGVGTIGNGFTAMSKVFSDYWMQTRGHKLRAGDTITKDESIMLLGKVMNAEYAPPVAKKYGDSLLQNEFDAVADAVYNCGAGTLKDHWAAALLAGNLSAAATDLLSTRITAGGKRLAGLVTRRSREAKLLLHGDYNGALVETTEPDTLSADLATLGYASVSDFQKANPPLDVDGVGGPATRAAVARALAAKKAKTIATQAAPAGTVTGAGAGAATAPANHLPDPTAATHALAAHTLMWGVGVGLAVLAAIAIGYLIYSHRGVILGKRTPA